MASPSARSAVSLGFDLEHPDIVGIDFRSSHSLLDYELVIWDPSHVLSEYRRDYSGTYRGLPLLHEDDSSLVLEELRRRRDEILELLRLGGCVAIFCSAPHRFFRATGEKEFSGTGRNRQTTSIVSDASVAAAFPLEVELIKAEGRRMDFRGDPSFGAFWRKHEGALRYRAYLKEPVGRTQAVIRRTTRAVAAVARVDQGWVALLPDIDYEGLSDDAIVKRNREVGSGVLEMLRTLRSDAEEFRLPRWTSEYRLAAENDARITLQKREESVKRAVGRRDRVRRELADLEQKKLLFSASGPALEVQVRHVFEGLGFTVEDAEESGRTDLVLKDEGVTAVVEIKGLTKSAREANAAQLEKWVSLELEKTAIRPKAILVVNGFCEQPLRDRDPNVFPSQMLPYASAREHCLMTGIQLLGAWVAVSRDAGRAADIRRSILSCVGRYEGFDDATAFLDFSMTESRSREGGES
ncbi:hypothetical protein HJD18_09665 [Thermoleophilia bacterium SCSIO 60948]|nr:hypothetical protein HJD18_09665 [Thermoleophilia bacterium SCSIO 60948]